MSKLRLFLFLLVLLACLSCQSILSQKFSGTRESFNSGWKFIKYDFASDEMAAIKEPMGLLLPTTDDSKWRTIDLPHDWAIEGPFSDTLENSTGLLPWKGIGWYRKHFTIGNEDSGKRIYIYFDGAMSNAKIWINGKFAGEWPYGYTSFRIDLTPFIIIGKENVVAVRLDTKNWDSRWYPGAGIYRNIWLVKKSQVHVAYNGLYCTTPEINREHGLISVEAEIENHRPEPSSVSVKASVYKLGSDLKKSDKPVAESGIISSFIGGNNVHRFRLDLDINNPMLWDISDPQLYRVILTVNSGKETADICQADIGFRTLEFTPRNGFKLNGRRVEIKGVCNHHDLGALGAAFNTSAAQRQLTILKEMGCNAIRTSHNPPAPELLELCDRMGFLVEDEAFDAWRTGKKPYDYNKLFDAWHEEDLRALVRRDRNHPSVFIWSIGNEVPDQGNNALSENLKRIVKSEDITRPVTSACDNPESGTNGFEKTLDVFGINYQLKSYKRFFALKDNENIPFHSSESASTVSSRGDYYFPVVQGDVFYNLPGKKIFQVSSYDLAYPTWASTPDQQWEMIDRYPATFGEFVWTGFDYLGEPTPYGDDITNLKKAQDDEYKQNVIKLLEFLGTEEIPSRSSYFGIMDLAGFKKDRFWLYQSRWRPDLPMAHILPHWNWPERKGLVTPVHVYTSGDAAELFLNGKSLGMKKKGPYEYRLRWDDVVYQPGELKVVAYKNGIKWAEDIVKTTGKPAIMEVSSDREKITADGYDLAFITVKIEDADGLLVPRSNNPVNFSIEGPGVIVATDNGDATNHDSFQSGSRKAYNGMCLVIVKARSGAAPFTVKAESKGLRSASINIGISN
jgi:beta-galactosidase